MTPQFKTERVSGSMQGTLQSVDHTVLIPSLSGLSRFTSAKVLMFPCSGLNVPAQYKMTGTADVSRRTFQTQEVP